MDKNNFLEKVKKDAVDEGLQHSKLKGLQLGYKIFLGLSIFLIIFNLIMGEDTFSIQSMFWAFIAADGYSNYKFSHVKSYKIQTIFSGIASGIFLLNHILHSLG